MRFIDGNFRMKIKFQTYKALHKRPLSRKQVIEIIKTDTIPNDIPNEIFDDLKKQMNQLSSEYMEKDDQLVRELEEILQKSTNQTDIVSLIKMSPNKRMLFNMYKNKEYSLLVWDLLK